MMNPERLLRLTLTVTRMTPGPPDEMGDPAPIAGTPANYKGWIWQDAASENTDNQNLSSEQYRAAIDRTAAGAIDSGDRVTYAGTVYEVFGPPWPATNPRTLVVEYLYLTLRRTA